MANVENSEKMRDDVDSRLWMLMAECFLENRRLEEEKVSGCAGIKPVWDRE
jgi:hypothetical protein